MKTEILKIISEQDMDKLAKAAAILKSGGLVAFPTETVYGLGGNALNKQSSEKIYKAKGRPSDNPLIVHIADKEDLKKYITDTPVHAVSLMERFWPGPLTLIFNKGNIIPKETCGGLKTVAIRMPSSPIASTLIKMSEIPIAAPSANISGKPSPTTAKHVLDDLDGKIEMIIDGGSSTLGLESTIVDVTGSIPWLLRPGSISLEMLKEVCPTIETDKSLFEKTNGDFKPKAPGMKYTHYAPKASVTVVSGSEHDVGRFINEKTQEYINNKIKVAVIATEETKHIYKCSTVLVSGSRENPESIAHNLFHLLRYSDELGIEQLFAEAVSEKGVGLAVMNRLLKASGYNHVKL